MNINISRNNNSRWLFRSGEPKFRGEKILKSKFTDNIKIPQKGTNIHCSLTKWQKNGF